MEIPFLRCVLTLFLKIEWPGFAPFLRGPPFNKERQSQFRWLGTY
jgi:hypothetical protein